MFPPRLFLIYCLILAVSLGLAVLISRKVKLPELSYPAGFIVLGLLALLHAWFYGFTYMTYHAQFSNGATDFTHFLQCLWKLSQGQAPVSSVLGMHLLRDHFSLLWYPVALAFKTLPSVETVVYLSCLSVASISVILYFVAWEATKSAWLGLAVGVSYLLNPYVQLGQLAAAHADCFSATVIAVSLLAAVKKHWPWFYGLALLAIAGKEDVGLYYGALGFYLWLGQKERMHGLAVALLGAAGAIGIRLWIMPQFGPDTEQLFAKYFSHLGGSPLSILRTFATRPWMLALPLFTWEKIFPIFYLLAQTGMVSLAAGWALLPLGAAVWFKSITNYDAMYNFWDHYSLHIMPFLYLASIVGIKRLLTSPDGIVSRLGCDHARMPACLTVFMLLLALLINMESGNNPLGRKFRPDRYVLTASQELGAKLVASIPGEASVLTEENIGPHLAFRPRLYLMSVWRKDPVEFARLHETDYVLFNLEAGNLPPAYRQKLKMVCDSYYEKQGYQKVADELGWRMYRQTPGNLQ